MKIDFPELRPINFERVDHPNPEQRQEDELIYLPNSGRLETRIWSSQSIPRSDKWVEAPNLEALPFAAPSEDYQGAYEQYREFQLRTQCISHLSAYTGQLAYAFGDLWPDNLGSSDEHAGAFLESNALMLGGRSQDIGLRRARRSTWRDKTASIDFHQVNQQQVPIVGAQIVLTYDSEEKLAFVDSSLFPITLDELPTFSRSTLTNSDFYKIVPSILSGIPEQRIEFGDLLYVAYNDSAEFRDIIEFGDRRRPFELWILPLHDQGIAHYEAAYRIFFVDRKEHAWALWLGANELNLLFLERRESHAPVEYMVYPRPLDAENGQKKKRVLDMGGTATTLQAAARVHVNGNRFFDPQDPGFVPTSPLTGADDPRHVLAANTFYHLWEVQFDFSTWMSELAEECEDNQQVNGRTILNPVNDISAELKATSGDGRFVYETGWIVLHTGVEGVPPVREPGFDGDVIAHEYAHAVLHYYYRSLFENSRATVLYNTAVEVLDEALAFYFACVHFNHARWGEYAYAGFTNRTFTDQIALFADVAAAANLAGGSYEYALWWAHIFWQLQQQTALQPVLPLLLLQVLRSLSQSPPSTESLNGSFTERLFNVFNRFADQIYLRAQEGSEKDAIGEVWAKCNFALPS